MVFGIDHDVVKVLIDAQQQDELESVVHAELLRVMLPSIRTAQMRPLRRSQSLLLRMMTTSLFKISGSMLRPLTLRQTYSVMLP